MVVYDKLVWVARKEFEGLEKVEVLKEVEAPMEDLLEAPTEVEVLEVSKEEEMVEAPKVDMEVEAPIEKIEVEAAEEEKVEAPEEVEAPKKAPLRFPQNEEWESGMREADIVL